MRRRSIALFSLAALAALSACGSSSKSTGGAKSPTTAAAAGASASTATSSSGAGAYGGGYPVASSPSTAAPNGGSTEAAAVTVKSLTFSSPNPVNAGSTFTVQNTDGIDHTFNADDGSFAAALPAGSSVQVKAPAKAGSYTYHCNIHNAMTGTLTVTA